MNENTRKAAAGEVEALPFAKIAQIALKGIRIRIWRSLLVVSCIVLAMAFLSYILGSDAFQRHLDERGSPGLVEKLVRNGTFNPEDSTNQRIQTYWMVGLAVLISFVGIVNAMLMSVTERFREIGTMKCLGALDSFVLKLFLIESAVVGSIGTTLGIGIGVVLAYAEGFAIYGAETWSLLRGGELFLIVVACIATGVAITILGAVYPAHKAAQMKPVVALRAEV